MLARLGLALMVALALPAEAQSGKSKSQGGGRGEARVSHARGSATEIRVIREYYRDPSRKLKPLPPGQYKYLARGKPVPRGILKTRFPELLESRMPRREGTTWWVAGDQVLLLDTNGLVVDFFRAVF